MKILTKSCLAAAFTASFLLSCCTENNAEAAGEEIGGEETAEEAGVPVIEVTDDVTESEPVSPEPDIPQPRAPEIELPADEYKQD